MIQILQTGTYKTNLKFKNQNAKLRKFVHCSLPACRRGRFTACLPARQVHCLRGFTLIELIVVIFIISLTMAVIMPSFWSTERDALKTETRHINSALRYIYDEAIGKKQTYLFTVNLDKESWGFESEKEFRNFRIKGDVEIRDIVVPSLGKVSNGEVIIKFGPTGPEEPLILHLKKGELEYTVIFNHLNGRTKIHEGYTL